MLTFSLTNFYILLPCCFCDSGCFLQFLLKDQLKKEIIQISLFGLI